MARPVDSKARTSLGTVQKVAANPGNLLAQAGRLVTS
jgi:hypothetical protein